MTIATIDAHPIDELLSEVVRRQATDLLITPGSPPRIRIDGRLVPLEGAPSLDADECRAMIVRMLPPGLRDELLENLELDFSFSDGRAHRFRANCYFRQSSLALSLRAIPLVIPRPEELGCPPVLKQVCELPQGFVIVTGPSGSGKSTTIASLIDYINRTRAVHILTIEDPIEYVHEHRLAAIDQREVGIDTKSFPRALRAALREDPDVLVVGEMRDPETIQFALTLAETGHLVFATLHTNDAAQAIDRISDVFVAERRAQVNVQLAASLAAVVSQRLLPRTGGGLVAAYEVLLANSAVRNLIREGRSYQLHNVMQSARADGMTTLESALNDLVASGAVTYDDATAHALRPADIVH